MSQKLTSRKLWVALLGGLAMYLNGFLPAGRQLPPEVLMSLAGLAAIYILGETAVDRARAKTQRPPSPPKPKA